VDIRWKSPQDPTNWENVLETQAFRSISIQLNGKKISGSKDCLYLNVFRSNQESVKLPALVYLHGGNNQIGSGQQFEGSFIASETNSVVATLNTRLNAFGFCCLPAIKTGDPYEDSGNFSLLDISKALEWIQTNIHAFDGDANNVTVSGFSSGARSALVMTISPLFRGEFHKIISFGGGMTTISHSESIPILSKAFASLLL
jgi:para-nitrobenzyl esterase